MDQRNHKNSSPRIKVIQKIYNALKIKGPVVVDVLVNPKTKVKPKIDFGKPLHDMSPALDRKVLNLLVKF